MTTFKSKKIQKKRTYKRKTKKNTDFTKKLLINLIGGFLIFSALSFLFMYNKYIKPLPDIKSLEEITIPEASIIYDRNGEKLYTLYSGEKRTYIDYEQIGDNIINAITSAEDKTFFTNQGIDIKGMFRAVFNYALNKTHKIEGTSTISQQLIRNVFLNNERKIERKIKEIYLSYKLNISYSKEKILELYLNKIAYGSNAHGIEQASLTFFGKTAKELNILEASIIASLPKGPTYYSPYNHFDRLVGYVYKFKKDNPEEISKVILKERLEKSSLAQNFKKIISNLKAKRLSEDKLLLCGIDNTKYKKYISIDNDGCSVLKYSDLLGFLNNIQLKSEDSVLEYQTGRKDFVLGRMLEDGKISFNEYKESILESIGFEFKEYTENINAPHFVFYVKEYLEKKYGKGIIGQEGLKVFTTLDLEKQKKAEEIIKNQVKINKNKFDSNNAALISIDNKTGEIISMVGGADYFDKENDGNVNIITSNRQPGSTFKPFVYAKAIERNKIGTYTPIYDLETEFPGGYKPNNYDGKFEGKMNIMTALNYSRNIPAIKMYFLAGEQKSIIPFMSKLGVKSLSENFYYGAPLAIGTGEMKAIELATAYSTFANMGYKKEITPILEIKDSKGNTIEKNNHGSGEKVIDSGLAYIINSILSSTYTRPNNYWNNYLSLNNRQASAKTGTSNKITNKKDNEGNNIILPRDMWTAGYTPDYTTVVWAGNTNGEQLNSKGNGLEGTGPIWKNFMEFLHKDKESTLWKKPNNVSSVNISTISGNLAGENQDKNFVKKALFLKKNLPIKYDNSLKQISYDDLCKGIVTDDTPKSAIKQGYLVNLKTIDPTKVKWEEGLKKWIDDGLAKEVFKDYENIITNYSNEVCKRDLNKLKNAEINFSTNIKNKDILLLGSKFIEIDFTSSNTVKKVEVLLNNNIIKTFFPEIKSGKLDFYLNLKKENFGRNDLTINIIDEIAFSKTKTIAFGVDNKKDTDSPIIKITNPIDKDIVLYQKQHFNLRAKIIDDSNIRSINIYLNGKILQNGLRDRDLIFPINENKDIELGEHIIKIEAVDQNFNISSEEVKLTIIEE